MHVGAHQVQTHNPMQDGHEDKTHADLDEPAPTAGAEHQPVPEQQPAPGQRHALAPPPAGRQLHEHQHAEHDRGQHAVEPRAVQAHAEQRAEDGARRGGRGQTQTEAKVGEAAAQEGAHRDDVLSDDRNAVGAVGHRPRHTEKQHDGHGQERAAAGHDIEHARAQADEGEQAELPEFSASHAAPPSGLTWGPWPGQPSVQGSRRVTNSSAVVGWTPIVLSKVALVAPACRAMAMP